MTEFLLVLLLLGLGGWWLFSGSQSQTRDARSGQRRWRTAVEEQLGLADVIHDRITLGVNVRKRAIAVVRSNGHGKWIPFEAIAGVELTPFYTRIEEGTSETSTRRGSQLIGAGIGAAIAGPAGMVVGGLSGGSRTQSSSSSSEFLSEMEIKLRLFSEEEPLLKWRLSGPVDFDPETKQFEGGLDGLERIAARLATEIECRQTSAEAAKRVSSFETFTVSPLPVVEEGLWSKTFG